MCGCHRLIRSSLVRSQQAARFAWRCAHEVNSWFVPRHVACAVLCVLNHLLATPRAHEHTDAHACSSVISSHCHRSRSRRYVKKKEAVWLCQPSRSLRVAAATAWRSPPGDDGGARRRQHRTRRRRRRADASGACLLHCVDSSGGGGGACGLGRLERVHSASVICASDAASSSARWLTSSTVGVSGLRCRHLVAFRHHRRGLAPARGRVPRRRLVQGGWW